MSSSSESSVSISALLKKTEHYDKDERYMATSDLCEVLKRQSEGSAPTPNNTNMDAATERQVCTAVLRLLHDKSNDVQAIAVKTLGVLLTTVQQEQVLEIADSLADQVLDASKSELRDVYAIGLRTLTKTIPAASGNRVSQRLVGRLLDGIRTSAEEEIVLACLDVLTDLLTRFGATALVLTRQHEPILQMGLDQLCTAQSAVVRKRAGTTMGCLSVVLSDAHLQRMVEALLQHIDMADGVGKEGRRKTRSAHKAAAERDSKMAAPVGDTRALIRTMCTVSGQTGHRLGQAQIDRILPIFLRFTEPEDAITGDDEDGMEDDEDADDADDEAATALANELRESCFMGFESFVLRCPKEVEPHLQSIVQAALAYMSYDPNYSYGDTDEGDEEEEDIEDDEYDDEDDEEEDDDDDDDDDDESWKVRRSAIRALKAVVEAKKLDPSTLWTVPYSVRRGKTSLVSTALVGRFKEREENCRVGVIECFTRLLSLTVAAARVGTLSFSSPNDMDTTESSTVSIDLRTEYAPKVVKACEKILATKKGNERSKSCALALLSTLCEAPGGVGGQAEISSVFKHVQAFLVQSGDMGLHREGTSKTLRLDALSLVHSMLASENHEPAHVRQSLRETLLPELCAAVKEQWYKVIAEALRALAEVPRFFCQDPESLKAETTQVAGMLYASIEPLLAAHDVDQEIKECALRANASLLSSLHATLDATQTGRLLSLLLDRLKNETTRIAAIKTLSAIASSPCDLDATFLADAIPTMASFLKLQSRSLKQSCLEAMDIVVTHHGAKFADGTLYASVLQELAPLVVDTDLHLSHLSLRASVSILKVCDKAGPAVKSHVLEPALVLSTSSLLQDHALDSLLALFTQMVQSGAVEFTALLGQLRDRLTDQVGKHGIYNLAKCIAVSTAATTSENGQQVLAETLQFLEAHSNAAPAPADVAKIQLALLITGDLGRMMDLGSIPGAADRLKAIYLGYFESNSEELKHAAAYALGNASVGSQATFLQAIVSKLDENNKKQQYLLLSALREFIKCSSDQSGGDGIAACLPTILPPLEKHCGDAEEGVRTMVAECLGSLVCLQPEVLLKKLAEAVQAHSEIVAPGGTIAEGDEASKKNALVCWTIASSIKLAIAGKVEAAVLSVYMPTFLVLLEKEELSVRNAALLMTYAAAHHLPQVVAPLLKDTIMPVLYEIANLKMQRKVDLGPFTHTVDDALPLRKATLSIFSTCLEHLPASLDIDAFMPVLAKALGDAEDIQLHAYQILISMCSRQPAHVVAAVDTFVEPLEKTANKKPGQKTGTELERLNDWIKSAIRVIQHLAKLEGAMQSRKFADFVERIRGNSKFAAMIASVDEERTS